MTIEIPTPLRVYTGNQSAVAVDAATVSEAVSALLTPLSRVQEASLHPRRQAALLRQPLPQRRRHPLSAPARRHARFEHSDTLSIIPSIAGGCWPSRRARLRRRNFGRLITAAGIAGRAGALRAKTIAVSTCTALSRSRILKEDSWPPPPNPSPCPSFPTTKSRATRATSSCPKWAWRASRSSRPPKSSASAPADSARRWRFYLAAAGIGTLGLVDFDVVDASNLQRQIIHSTEGRRPPEDRLRRREARRR